MSLRFDFTAPGDVRVGAGRVVEVGTVLSGLGVTRALLVTGRDPTRADVARRVMDDVGTFVEVFPVAGEPSVDTVRHGVAVASELGCDGVVGFGGGSALDTAKAVALLAATGGDPLDHLEVVGRGAPVVRPGLPCVAVPTTAGTGSEVTRNAVLTADRVKASLRSPLMLPRVALVDPNLLAGLPAETIAHSGMDALTQLIEPFLSRRANPITDGLAREGLRRSARALRAAFDEGLDGTDAAQRREDLAVASVLGGLSLANAGLGIAHGIASVVGGRWPAPHGALCAALVAPATAVNVRALRERAPDHPSLVKADELGVLLTGERGTGVEDALAWLSELRDGLAVPGLRQLGVDPDAPDLLEAVARASSTKANPVDLTPSEIAEVLARAG